MMRSILVYVSWLGRHAVSFGVCFLAVRVLLGAVAVAKARSSDARAAAPRESTGRSALDKLLDAPDMSEVKKLADAAKAEKSEKVEEPKVRQRSIMVDFGPARSEVFINGRRVGNTPYAGQLGCRDGDKVRVQVVPSSGVPLEKMMFCPVSAESVSEFE